MEVFPKGEVGQALVGDGLQVARPKNVLLGVFPISVWALLVAAWGQEESWFFISCCYLRPRGGVGGHLLQRHWVLPAARRLWWQRGWGLTPSETPAV